MGKTPTIFEVVAGCLVMDFSDYRKDIGSPRYRLEYVKQNHGPLIERFERWHNVNHRP